jgi:hypothetical protein
MKLEGIEIDGTVYYKVNELVEKKIAGKSTIYRKKREGRIALYYSLNGEPMVKAEDLTRLIKKSSAA